MKLLWTAEQRLDTYTTIRHALTRFVLDDRALVQRLNNSRPDGYPTNSMPGPGQHGSITDRVAGIVTVRIDGKKDRNGELVTDPAEQAFALLYEAAKLLEQADSQRARAVPPIKVNERADDLWCASCLRFGICEPRSNRKGGRTDLCSWCQDEYLGSSTDPNKRELPPRQLVEAKHRGIRLTKNKRAELLGKKAG